MNVFLFYFLACFLGYLIGSINPAYFFGRLIKKIDIRNYGSKNAGATNAFNVISKPIGIITGSFDALKGVLSILLIYWLSSRLGIKSIFPLLLAGFMAIFGHDFPFYLRFKGGKGAAAAYGIFVFLGVLMAVYGSPILPLILITITLFLLAIIIKTTSFSSLLVWPFFFIYTLWNLPLLKSGQHFFQFGPSLGLFAILILCYIFVTTIIVLKREGFCQKVKFAQRIDVPKIKIWRKILRLSAFIFPLFLFFFDKKAALLLSGLILLLSLIFDLIKYWFKKSFHPVLKKIYKSVYKEKERFGVTRISYFLISCFLTILLFPKGIAIIALSFFIFSDTFAEIVGIKFGKIKLIGRKTLEGFLAAFLSALYIGLIWSKWLGFSFWVVLIGAFFAALIELISIKIDDNLTVSLGSGLVMLFLRGLL